MATKLMTDAPTARERLLQGVPVRERRLELDGISTTLLEGGSGTPVVLLHGPGEHAVKWVPVLRGLVARNRVIAPDLPGHGGAKVNGGPLTAERVLGWLGALIGETCASAPVVVGQTVGGAIAARFAIGHGDRIRRLVLVDTLGLVPFEPAPEFGAALGAYVAQPNRETFEALWRRCAFDLDRVREVWGDRWEAFAEYSLNLALTSGTLPAQGALIEQFGMAPIPPDDLARIAVPTTLIWGRQDLVTDVAVAEAASARYGWPLHVIESAGDDPATEQPERFLEALQVALA